MLAYLLVILEEKTRMKKSKPVMLMGCLMWMFIGIYESQHGGGKAHAFLKELIGEIGELFFFLFVAMTYIITLDERDVFNVLRAWLIRKGWGFRKLFWATGLLAFLISPVADNLTTALLMATVALAVSNGNPQFIVPAFVNIVVAANAGGAWSPFGDITTLMIWTSEKVQTQQFLWLLIPATVNWLVPALIMNPFIPKGTPRGSPENIALKPGAKAIITLGILTLFTSASFHHFLHLPPYLGMLLGFSLLMMMGFYLSRWEEKNWRMSSSTEQDRGSNDHFDIFSKMASVEFDTLLFFVGILTAVGALQYLGYLTILNGGLYGTMSPTLANILIGIASSLIDNIPLTYAVIKMNPAMGLDQWLLITLTAGVGGSLLSIGSAAGVAVMGVDRKNYTFMAHLKWMPAIAAGYFASIAAWRWATLGLS